MRRLFALLLLAWLPLQSSWAVVAVYCAHEGTAQVRHMGHHEHELEHEHAEASAPVQGGSADNSAAGGAHFDCDHCHCAGPGLLVRLPALTLQLNAIVPSAHLRRPEASGLVERPERPQWARLA